MKYLLALLLLPTMAYSAITSVTETTAVQLKRSTSNIGTPYATQALCNAEAERLWLIEGLTRTTGYVTYACGSTKWLVRFGVAPPPPTAETWTHCANEGELCAYTGTRRVRYGAGTTWSVPIERPAVNGGIQCSNAVFGDPIQFTEKTCELSDAVITAPPTGTGSATLSWVAPTHNNDGSVLTNLAGFVIRYGTQNITLDAAARSRVIGGLPSGTHVFNITAINSAGVESAPAIGSKVIP